MHACCSCKIEIVMHGSGIGRENNDSDRTRLLPCTQAGLRQASKAAVLIMTGTCFFISTHNASGFLTTMQHDSHNTFLSYDITGKSSAVEILFG